MRYLDKEVDRLPNSFSDNSADADAGNNHELLLLLDTDSVGSNGHHLGYLDSHNHHRLPDVCSYCSDAGRRIHFGRSFHGKDYHGTVAAVAAESIPE